MPPEKKIEVKAKTAFTHIKLILNKLPKSFDFFFSLNLPKNKNEVQKMTKIE